MPPVEEVPGSKEVTIPLRNGLPVEWPSTWSLEFVEQLALVRNPAIAAASARLEAARGEWLQAGLLPNPTVGYVGSEIGNEGQAGQQGLYVNQTFRNRSKPAAARAQASAEITRLQQSLQVTEQRVLTDVRRSYFAALVLARQLELTRQLRNIANQAVDTSGQLVQAGEARLVESVQAEVEAGRATVALQAVENDYQAAWESLAALLGLPNLAPPDARGDIEQLPMPSGWGELLTNVVSQSPELAEAYAAVEAARRQIRSAATQVLPDVRGQFSVQYDDATQDVVAGVQLGVPLPLRNRYQGDVMAARARYTESLRKAEVIEGRLRQQLAQVYYAHMSARIQVDRFRQELLPKSQRALALIRQGYSAGEANFLELLTAQRTYFESNLGYLAALSEFWDTRWQLEGYLLAGSYTAEN